jgi:hypothetical protein
VAYGKSAIILRSFKLQTLFEQVEKPSHLRFVQIVEDIVLGSGSVKEMRVRRDVDRTDGAACAV